MRCIPHCGLVLVLAAWSCTESIQPPSREAVPQTVLDRAARGNAGKPRPDDEAARVEPPPAPSPNAAPVRPMEVRQATAMPDDLFALRRARRGRRIVRGNRLALEDAKGGDDRLIVLSGRGEQQRVWLVDIDRGKKLAQVSTVHEASPEAGVFTTVAGRDDQPAIVRMDTGEVVVPRPRLPGDARVVDTRIATRGRGIYGPGIAAVWVFARSEDGAIYYGQWVDLGDPRPTLEARFPFWPRSYFVSDRLELTIGDGTPAGPEAVADGDCVHMAIGGGRKPVCRASSAAPEPTRRPMYLGDGWAFYAGEMRNAETGRVEPVIERCRSRSHAALESPPRLLAYCDRGDSRDYVLWAPDRRWTWTVGDTGNTTNQQHPVDEPVLSVKDLWYSDLPTEQWLDVERGVITETETLLPISLLPWMGRQLLAVRPGTRPVELVLVDLDDNTVRTVARYDDCDGELSQYADADSRVALVCRKQSRPGYYRFAIRWSEVIDLAAHVRWRSSLHPERLLPNGRVVASDRTAIAGESRTAAKNLYVLELP